MPTQVQALSSGVSDSGWQVTTGNSFGTICGWQSDMADARFPTMDGSTGVTIISYSQQSLTGTIPAAIRNCRRLKKVKLWLQTYTLANLMKHPHSSLRSLQMCFMENKLECPVPVEVRVLRAAPPPGRASPGW